jgi:hypothetical protein
VWDELSTSVARKGQRGKRERQAAPPAIARAGGA